MKLSALSSLSFNNNVNYAEIRKRIVRGEPIGSYDCYRLVTIPEDVFIMHAYDDNCNQQVPEPSQINTGTITQKIGSANGKLGYLWNKVSQKCPNVKSATKAFLAYLGIDQALDITHTIKDKTGEISQTINDKISSAFDDLNDKIKDFSFKKLDNLAKDIVDKNQDVIQEDSNTTHHLTNHTSDDAIVHSDENDIQAHEPEHHANNHEHDTGDDVADTTTSDDTPFDDSVFEA